MSDEVRVRHGRQLRGSVRVPGDKSASHRALMISALAAGESTIAGLSPGKDVASTSRIVQQLGATLGVEDGLVLVNGPERGLRATAEALDCGNSGTTMRLLCGLVAAIPGTHRLVGDASLSTRPMDRVARPLALMGARVLGEGDAITAPLTVTGASVVHGIRYQVPVASAQVKSAVLFAGLAGDGVTTVEEAVRTRATTEEMLARAGVAVTSTDVGEGREVALHPGRPKRHQWFVPGDPSQAAFFAVLGAVHPDASLEVLSLDAAPERVGYVGVLQRMGANTRLVEHSRGFSLRSMSSELEATEVHASEIPSVDEVPVLVVAACAATGVSAFRSMSELRVKESDRFAGSIALAEQLGCRSWSEGEDLFVEGVGSAAGFTSFSLAPSLDHRMVMAAAVAGFAGAGCVIAGADTVASSYPNFFRDLALLQ